MGSAENLGLAASAVAHSEWRKRAVELVEVMKSDGGSGLGQVNEIFIGYCRARELGKGQRRRVRALMLGEEEVEDGEGDGDDMDDLMGYISSKKRSVKLRGFAAL